MYLLPDTLWGKFSQTCQSVRKDSSLQVQCRRSSFGAGINDQWTVNSESRAESDAALAQSLTCSIRASRGADLEVVSNNISVCVQI